MNSWGTAISGGGVEEEAPERQQENRSGAHPPATRNTADWWLSHWISELKAAKNSSQEALAPTRLGSVGPLSAQLLLFSPGSL